MDRRRNPFVPGAGLQPPELAGRDRLLADASIDMDRVLDGRPAKGLILLGLRGVGKTVLLNRLRALADRHTAVGLFIDEVQYLSSSELAAVIVACHEIAQQNLPFLFVGAGLPQVAALAGKAKSYAERLFDYPEVGPLDGRDARLALEKPAREEGVSFDRDAVDEILAAARNFPYFIQEWGYQVWNAAPASPITRGMVRAATPEVVAHLDKNFFRVRFDRLTPLEQKYLRAMAELGPEPCATGRIAETLGVRTASIATVRQRLINKGMVWSQRHGETAFTVPMFDALMKRQMPEFMRHVPQRRAGR